MSKGPLEIQLFFDIGELNAMRSSLRKTITFAITFDGKWSSAENILKTLIKCLQVASFAWSQSDLAWDQLWSRVSDWEITWNCSFS